MGAGLRFVEPGREVKDASELEMLLMLTMRPASPVLSRAEAGKHYPIGYLRVGFAQIDTDSSGQFTRQAHP